MGLLEHPAERPLEGDAEAPARPVLDELLTSLEGLRVRGKPHYVS
jgi:hypothetical protein